MVKKLTEQQKAVVNIKEDGVYSIRAVAGSGKTFTAIEYMKEHSDEYILYLVFNSGNRAELKEKLSEQGIKNVDVHTVHSYCYSKTIGKAKARKGQFYEYMQECPKIKLGDGVLPEDLMEVYGLSYNSSRNILEWYNKYLHSDIKDYYNFLNVYRPSMKDTQKNALVKMFDWIDSSILCGDYTITHDWYVKWCSDNLDTDKTYDTVIVDEAQDISAVMLKIILNFKCNKLLLIGDSEQLIYEWRGAIDSLTEIYKYRKNVKFMELTHSFRVGEEIAKFASILTAKEVIGKGNNTFTDELEIVKSDKYTVMGFSNSSLFSWYAEHFQDLDKVPTYFRNFDPREIWDIINFYEENYGRVYDKTLLKFETFGKLVKVLDFDGVLGSAEKAAFDKQFGGIEEKYSEYVRLVLRYGVNFLRCILARIKSNSVEFGKERILLTTVHTSKGAEYDNLIMLWGGLKDFGLIDDILKSERLRSEIEKERGLVNKELIPLLNLLYVAVTRAKGKVYFVNDVVYKHITGNDREI